MKKAPIDHIHIALDVIAREQASVCAAMAAGQVALLPRLLAITEEISRLRFVREEIIRDTFCR